MRTGRGVVVVFGDAGRQLDNDFILFDTFFLFQGAFEQGQFTVQGPAAASAAGQVDHAVLFIRRVIGESAGAFVEGFFAQIAGAALFDNVALYDDEIIFLGQVH